jgi:hypothetical protein
LVIIVAKPKSTGRKLAETVLYVAVAGIIMYSELLKLAQGIPIGDEITDIILGVSLLILYFGLRIADWFGHSRSYPSRFGLWALFILSVYFGIVGMLLYNFVASSGEALGMVLGGMFGLGGSSYGLWKIPKEGRS